MTQFVVDLLDGSNNALGSGPLQNVLSVSVTSKLDEAGAISFTVPATDVRAATLIDTATRFRIRTSSGATYYGIIDKDSTDVTADQPTRLVYGADMLRELQHYSMGWWCFFNDQDLNTVVLPALVADTPWSTGTIDAGLGTLYYRFDGDSRLAALLKIVEATGKHFRLGSTFRTIDFGVFGVASTIRFTNVDHALKAQDTTTDIAIIGSLQIINDRAPVVNRIIPWGAGEDGGDTNRAKVSLFHLTPGDSRWANIKAKAGVRGATATISAVGDYGVRYVVNSNVGFITVPVTQLMWCYDAADLSLGRGIDFVTDHLESTTDVLVRGSGTIPAEPTSFPATLISNPQLYIEDATAYAADPREAVIIFSDITPTDAGTGAFESAASQLYNRAYAFLQKYKSPQTAYAVSVFNCPDSLKVGDTVQIIYRGVVTRDGVVTKWVDLNDTFNVINITRTFNADGSTSATVEVSDVARQPTDSSTAMADSAGQSGTMSVTVGTPSLSSAGGGGVSGPPAPITVSLPLVRTINNITLPLATDHILLGVAGAATDTAAAALTKTDDTNVTLTLGGSPSTALVHAASITAGWSGQLSPARGGTGSSNAGNLAWPSTGGTAALLGTANVFTQPNTFPSVHMATGSPPASPTAGDVWFTADGLLVKSNDGYFHQIDRGTNTAGITSAPVITNNGDGTINVAAGVTAWLYSAASWAGDYKSYAIPAATNLALTDGAAGAGGQINYLIVSYNAGSPVYSITTNPATINSSSICIAAIMMRDGTEIHAQGVNWGLATAIRLNDRSINIERYTRISGLLLTETATRVINIASGVFYYGVTAVSKSAVTSASSNAYLYYVAAGVWARTLASDYNNTQYNNVTTGLQTLSSGRYAVNWVYRFVDGGGVPQIAYVLGGDNYTLSQAKESTVPTLPVALQRITILVGRIIVQKNASTATQIDSAFTEVFAGTTISDHNSLSGLNTGDYMHLTAAEYGALPTQRARINQVGGIAKGQAVYLSGATGGLPIISLADNTDFTKADVLGIAAESGINNSTIDITLQGIVSDFDTSAWAEGAILYLTTAGNLTTTHPTGINAVQRIGHVVNSHSSSGSIIVDRDPLTFIDTFNGLVRMHMVNLSSGTNASTLIGVVNDAGHRATLSIPSSGFTTVAGIANSLVLYNEGYNKTVFTTDGNFGYEWWTDVTAAHNYSATSKMSLTAAGNLAVVGTVQGTQLISTIATGTAPLTVASTTVVANLNASLLEGHSASYFATATHDMITAHTYTGGAALDVFGLSGANTIARLTPSANPGAAAAILRSADTTGLLTLARLDVDFSKTISANDAGYYYASTIKKTLAGTGDFTNPSFAPTLVSQATTDADYAGTIASLSSLAGDVTLASAGATITQAAAVQGLIRATAGTIANAIVFKNISYNAGGTVVNFFVLADNNAPIGTTLNYFLYNQSAGFRNYLAGDTGVGIALPEKKLHVITGAATSLVYQLKLQGGTATNTGNAVGMIFMSGQDAGRGKGAIVFQDDGSGYNRGDIHVLVDNAADVNEAALSDVVATFKSDGNFGLGTTLAGAGVTYQKLNVNGSQLFVGADSSQESPMLQIVPSYATDTHASYKARAVVSIWDIGGARSALQIDTDGSTADVLIDSLIYGSMYADDITQAVTVASANVYYKVPGSMTVGLCNGFTLASSRELICTVAGTYHVVWGMLITSATNNENISGAAMVNTTEVHTSEGSAQCINSSKPVHVSGSAFVALAVNDVLALCVQNEDAAHDITVYHANISAVRIGA